MALFSQGAGFAAFGQTKPVVTPFGQVAAAGVSSNPFMVRWNFKYKLLHVTLKWGKTGCDSSRSCLVFCW